MKTWRFWASLGAVPLWGALLLAVWAGLNASANRQLKRELDRIQAAGHPLVPAQVAPPALPDADNAAHVVLRAFAVLKEDAGDFTERERFVTDWTLVPEMTPKAEAWIGANAPALAELKRAAERPASRYPVDYAKGLAAETPSLSAALRAVDLLGAAARLAHARGDAVETDRLIAVAFRLGLDWSEEPVQFMWSIGMGLFKKTSLMWQAALNAGHPPGPAVRKVISALKPGRSAANCRRGLASDRAMILSLVLSNPSAEAEIPLFRPQYRPLLKKELARCSGLFQAAIDNLGPPPASRAWTRPSAEDVVRGGGFLGEMLFFPDFSRIAGMAIEGDASMDFALAALDALGGDGPWPPPAEAFASLTDRFTGRPAALVRDGERLVLVSVGRDLVLDGGDPKKDVVFKLPARRPR